MKLRTLSPRPRPSANRDYDGTDAAVDRKLAAGEIYVGKPVLRPGEKLGVIDNGTRYQIEETQ